MSHPEIDQAFLSRFDDVCRRARRMHIGWVLAGLVAVAALAFALLAALDWQWELTRPVRQVLVGGTAVLLGAAALRLLVRGIRRWSAPSTAAELEHHFPSLGQRVRTSIQFGREPEEALREDGVVPSLVTALSRETAEKTRPLGLDEVAPTGRFWLAGIAAAVAVVSLAASALENREWRTALSRTLLQEVPYTTLAVRPGDVTIEEGQSVELQLAVGGRTNRLVQVLSRPAGQPDAEWTEEQLDPKGASRADDGSLTYTSQLARIREPMEYRVVAGPAESETYRIGVRYPLSMQAVTARVTPPAYTGLPTTTVMDGNLSALRGSTAVVTVTLDRVPASASLQFRPLGSGSAPLPPTPAARIEQTSVTFTLPVEQDLQWSLAANSVDDTALPEKLFRLRVREDQPPRVSFVSPDAELEVHSLAEIPMTLRATDDYGLARSGIVFQINSDEEHTLLEEDFAAATAALAQAAAEAGSPAGVSHRTRAELERTLPLEYFALTQKDCVAYYAFAEDNFPEQPHRSETDLRFIDIRPFKQIWRIDESEPGENMGGGGDLVGLEELIRRQRYALNRTIRLNKFPDRWGDGELKTVDRLINYQSDVAAATRELAEMLQGRGIDDADILFQAEGAMLTAVDSLNVGNNETAVLQEKDAQQYLVEARDRLEFTLRNNARARAAIRQANRQLSQKLRRPRTDEELQRQLVERLMQLAMQQQGVAGSLAGMTGNNGNGGMPTDPQSPVENTAGNTDPVEPMANADPDAEPMPNSDPDGDPMPPEGGESETETETPGGTGAAESEMEEDSDSAGPSLQDLQDRQADIVAEALDLQRVMNAMPEATDLARQRIQSAAQSADAASGGLIREELDDATAAAESAAEQFREVARQMAALLAPETAQQVAMARDLAGELAYRESELADDLEMQELRASAGSEQTDAADAAGASDPGQDPVDEAERIAATGQTLEDLLQAIARSNNPDSVEAKDRVAELYETEDVSGVVERMQSLPDAVESSASLSGILVELRDLQERMEVTALQLDQLYRLIVAPRIEELKQLDERVASLQSELDMLQTESELGGWHDDLDELLNDLDEEQIGGGPAEEMRETVAQMGPRNDPSQWRIGPNGYFEGPDRYRVQLRLIAEAIQQHIQELLLTDLLSSEDEATPPGFAPLVDQYLKVLATEPGATAP